MSGQAQSALCILSLASTNQWWMLLLVIWTSSWLHHTGLLTSLHEFCIFCVSLCSLDTMNPENSALKALREPLFESIRVLVKVVVETEVRHTWQMFEVGVIDRLVLEV